MDSARFAIDSDNEFYLEHLPVLDGLLSIGLTLFVDKDFPKYHDMTLIQYAIAKRKPKTLELMLKRVKDLNIGMQDIMFPKTSNTRGSILRLAIEFGSKGQNGYETVDNTCLKTIIKVLNINGLENTTAESPLILAIRYKNVDAVEVLMENNADFFYPLKENENNITDETILSQMPIMVLFKHHDDREELEEIFTKVLKEKGVEILQRLIKLKVSGNDFENLLEKLPEAKSFIIDFRGNKIPSIPNIENKDPNPASPKPNPDKPEETGNDSNSSTATICSVENCNKIGNICPKCKKYFCEDHIDSDRHECS